MMGLDLSLCVKLTPPTRALGPPPPIPNGAKPGRYTVCPCLYVCLWRPRLGKSSSGHGVGVVERDPKGMGLPFCGHNLPRPSGHQLSPEKEPPSRS